VKKFFRVKIDTAWQRLERLLQEEDWAVGAHTLKAIKGEQTHTVSWTKSTPSRNSIQAPTSPPRTAPKPSYSQVAIRHPPEPAIKPGQRPATKENLRPRDPGKSPPRDLTRDSSRDIRTVKQAHDLTARDRGNLTHDLPRDWSSTRSPDRMHFLRASRPLIHTWKNMGTING